MNGLLTNPFVLGLALGLFFAAIIFFRYLRLGGEMKRYRRHLSDKLEIEAESIRRIRQEQEQLRKENENLRVRAATLNETPELRQQRDLEVFARAEKKMFLSVPGFAPAWETAKNEALRELEEEAAGRSLPKKVFTRLFGSSSKEEIKNLPSSDSQ